MVLAISFSLVPTALYLYRWKTVFSQPLCATSESQKQASVPLISDDESLIELAGSSRESSSARTSCLNYPLTLYSLHVEKAIACIWVLLIPCCSAAQSMLS